MSVLLGKTRAHSQVNVHVLHAVTDLPQLCILRLRLNQHRKIGIRVLPKREEILIRCPGFDGVALQRISTGEWLLRTRREPSRILFRNKVYF